MPQLSSALFWNKLEVCALHADFFFKPLFTTTCNMPVTFKTLCTMEHKKLTKAYKRALKFKESYNWRLHWF